jgi:tetratricopeptide (TPR) repeat protein
MPKQQNPTDEGGHDANVKPRRGAPLGHSRISPAPPMPLTSRPEWRVLADRGGALGYTLWRVVVDVLLWSGASPEERRVLFETPSDPAGEVLSLAVVEAPELKEALQALWVVQRMPELADAQELADACDTVVAWAEAHGLNETAIQYAELASRLQPESASRAFVAGRLLRRRGEVQRAGAWYWRSARLARRANSNIDRANAHLGLGNLELDLGNYATAERHFWKAAKAALRNGRKSLAAAAYHNLIGVAYEAGRYAEALEHLQNAADFYKPDHPRFPVLAYDAGFILLRAGYFSCALLVFEKLLPWFEGDRFSIVVRAAYARAAAAVRDHIRYHRMSNVVLSMVAVDDERSANAMYQLAEGARSFLDWDRGRALSMRALELARRTDPATVPFVESLLQAIEAKLPGDVDRVPDEGDPVDRVTQEVLRKLEHRTTPPGSRAAPPERYPTD